MFLRVILGVILFFGSVAYAQETGMKTVDVQVDASKITVASADLNQIDVDFCEMPGEKHISYYLSQGREKQICLQISNNTPYFQKINIGFVDAIVTNDQWQNPACKDQSDKSVFSDYVTGYQTSILVSGFSIQKIYPIIKYPFAGTGTTSGCLVYYLENTPIGGNVAFSVLMRRAKFIDLYVNRDVNLWGDKEKYIIALFVFVLLIVGFNFLRKYYK